MINKKAYYIVSLVLFTIGVAVLAVYVNKYRKAEYYSNMTGVTGEDQNLTVTGKIVALSGGHQLGNSFFPNLNGNITLVPGMNNSNKRGDIDLKSNVNVTNRLVVGDSLCIGDNVNCIDKDTLANMKGSLQSEGTSIRCLDDSKPGAVYHYLSGQRFHYTSPSVASRFDSKWRSAKAMNCSRIPEGNPLR